MNFQKKELGKKKNYSNIHTLISFLKGNTLKSFLFKKWVVLKNIKTWKEIKTGT